MHEVVDVPTTVSDAAADNEIGEAVRELGVRYLGERDRYLAFERVDPSPIAPEELDQLAGRIMHVIRRLRAEHEPVRVLFGNTNGITIS
jgi:hypothetical protein